MFAEDAQNANLDHDGAQNLFCSILAKLNLI